MDWYLTIKTIHILSAAVLFGTGIGIAFFMLQSYFSDDLNVKFYATRTTVIADYVFTLPAVLLQPISGMWLIWQGGYSWDETWLLITYGLYIFIGSLWLPVVWIQIRLKNMLLQVTKHKSPLPETYNKLFRIWFLMGWPAFIALIGIFILMEFKPL